MIVQTQTTSFKVELLQGYHAFDSSYRAADIFKIALYTSLANLDATTAVYSASGEATGDNYVAGGQVILPIAPVAYYTTACLSFNSVSWAGAITANSALIYNNSQGNRSVCILNFGSNKTSRNSFDITFPVNDQFNAVIRIA